ncbi:MAG: M48 family metallopeptidase [Chitinophagaceae bacterium]|nr:M48 family metallopeptidase [Chitinophagaceae bacterium]
MKTYLGQYILPGHAETECTVLVYEKKLRIGYTLPDGRHNIEEWDIREVDAVYDIAQQMTRLKRRNMAGEVKLNGKETSLYIQQLQAERHKPWHKKRNAREWMRNLLLIVGLFGGIFLLYLLIVPWLSEKMAGRVSIKTEEQFGDAVYDALGVSANADTVAGAYLNEFFKAMEVPTPYQIRISVSNSDVVNAFALPGGRIVVYKTLLQKINSYEELAALLSHEFVHVQNRHSTKSIFRRLGSRIFLGLLFGRFGSVAAVLADHADNLKSLKYSRRLEKEADLEGLKILLDRKINPKGFVDLFENLKKSAPANALPEFLNSHPDLDDRMAYIREHSKNAQPEENKKLKTIFETLKSKIAIYANDNHQHN